ncbi:MAG TPA: NAD(P)H-dependent glycerol-3-phosphate dehydrogenase [Ruminococcaceae bacterium]|nr:NAD(P)H-dependent glycerol-3-phosphate dehydrogenase [Oscillospiraceae bacterium]
MAKIAVLGCGFGTALAVMADGCGHQVTLWSLFPQELEEIRQDGEQKKLLPGVPVTERIALTSDISCLADCDLCIMAVPSFAVRQTAQRAAPYLREGAIVLNVAKGLEDKTYKRLSQVLEEELSKQKIVVMSGPSHAEEVGRGAPTTITVASRERAAAEEVQDLLMNPTLRLYVNDDVIGVELGGALKNVIALAAGIADGLQLGDNAKAALMTRGITEIARLGVAMGAKTETFAGLSGIGDLIVTCTSMHSRNRRAGILIGQGKSAEEAVRSVGTVEGYPCAKTAYELGQKLRVEMPIVEQSYAVLYEGKSPAQALRDLMTRPKRHESEVIWLLGR